MDSLLVATQHEPIEVGQGLQLVSLVSAQTSDPQADSKKSDCPLNSATRNHASYAIVVNTQASPSLVHKQFGSH